MTNVNLVIETPFDFSFRRTVDSHGWRDLLPFSWDSGSGTLTRIERFDGAEPVRIVFSAAPEGGIAVEADAERDPKEIRRIATRIFQLDLSLAEFYTFCVDRPELAHIPVERHGRFLCSPTLFEDALKVLLTTNTTWAQTKAMVARITNAFGSPLPADRPETMPATGDTDGIAQHAFPMAEQIAAVPLERFAEVAKVGYRARAAHTLAVDVCEGRLNLEELRNPDLSSEDVWRRLLALNGIGPYGAACLMLYLGRGDRINVDSWARMLVSRQLGIKAADKDVHEFFAGFGPWKGFAYSFYRWAGDAPC